MKETVEVVEVEGTTSEAFNTMVQCIYKPPGGDTFNLNDVQCPQKLFELLDLAERYEIQNLATMTSDALTRNRSVAEIASGHTRFAT